MKFMQPLAKIDSLASMEDLVIYARQESSPPGPPYAPTTTNLGGLATISLDIPISAVFLFLFIIGGIAHMSIFQQNRKHSHKFLISGLMFGFCMARTVTCIMRIVWANRPHSVPIAIAAQIFVAAGVVLLFIIDLIFAQRILRALHPNSGWHPLFNNIFRALYAVIVISLLLLVALLVQSFYTLDENQHRIARDVQLCAGTYFAIVAFLPIPLVLFGLWVPRKTRLDKFGSGRFRSKVRILLAASFLLSLGAWFRVGTLYLTPRSPGNPAWYQSKACFYVFNFSVDVIIIWFYFIVRVDKRFYVLDGSSGPGDYSRNAAAGRTDRQVGGEPARKIVSEEEVFDDMPEKSAGQKVSNQPGAEVLHSTQNYS